MGKNRKQKIVQRDAFDDPNIPLSVALAQGWSKPSTTGFPVSAQTVMGIPAVKRAIQIISGHIARLDIVGYQIGRNGSRTPAVDHPAYNLLHWRPSPLYSAVDWKQSVMVDILIVGNHYSWIITDDYGRAEEILRLDPASVRPLVSGNQIVYEVRMSDGKKKYLLSHEVLHFKGTCGNAIMGLSIIDSMSEALGLSGALLRFSSEYFSNNCAPGMILEATKPMSKGKEGIEQTRANLERLHMGLKKSHKLAVIPDGLKLVQNQLNAEQSQLLESRQFSLVDISNAIGISANRLGSAIATSYGSLEAENRALMEDLEIYLCSIAEEINYKLLSEAEKRLGRIYFDFDRSSMQKPDPKTQDDIWTSRVNNGLATFNEYRQATDQETTTEDFGDFHRMPSNLTFAELASSPPEPAPPAIPAVPGTPQDGPAGAQQSAEQVKPADAPAEQGKASDRLRTLIDLDVDRLITRLSKAIDGKPAEWFESADFLGHRDVFVRALPFGETVIDDFLSEVIHLRTIPTSKVQSLKEILWTI